MEYRESLNEEENQPDNINESFEELLQKKTETEKKMKKKFVRVVTLMNTDIKGSTAFQQARGDIEAAALVTLHNKLLKLVLSKSGGKVISYATDGASVSFENTPENAVKTAIEFMQEVHRYNENNHTKLNIRISMNHGPVIVKSEKHLIGLTMNTTARVEQFIREFEKKNKEIAKTGLIFISGAVYDEIRNSEDIICRWVDQVEAKGLDEPLDLYRVVWNLEQERILLKSAIPSNTSRGKDSSKPRYNVTASKKQNVFIVEITKESDKFKICSYESAEHEQKTVRHYEKVKVDNEKIEKYIQKIIVLLNLTTRSGSIDKTVLNNLKSAGHGLYDKIFTENIKSKFANTMSEDLIISIDDHLVHIPWEMLYDGTSFLCLRFNMGRIVSTRQTISEGVSRPMSMPLKMLVLSDPTNNLSIANKEGHNIQSKLEFMLSPINVKVKAGNIKSSYVTEKIHNFDIVHYAGHSDYDSANPAQSGWMLNDKKLVAGKIRKMGESQPMPALVFSNACQSGQTDKWEISDDYESKIYGMANAFLLAGVNHYIGTFWEILDEPSSQFAMSFYEHMTSGKSIGEAVKLSRKDLINRYGEETIIWASYMLYGNPGFCYINPLVQDEGRPAETGEKEQTSHIQAGGGIRSASEAIAIEAVRPSKTNILYWLGGIAAIILIISALLFFTQARQTDVLVKSVQQAQTELAIQQTEKNQDSFAEKKANQGKRIDTLVTELAGKFREGTINNKANEPIDEWVSRPLIVSFFPLKIQGNNSDAYQGMILNNIAEYFETSNRVRLVDRELIGKLLEELKLSSSDVADKQTALRIGKLVGARFIASGSILSIGKDIKVSMKLIETETTSIVKTRTQTCTGPDSLSTLTDEMSKELLDALISRFPLRARIIGFADNDVVINIGRNHGMVKGIKLNVYDEKKVEGSNKAMVIKAGTIEVRAVEGNVSTGTVISKTLELDNNMKLGEVL